MSIAPPRARPAGFDALILEHGEAVRGVARRLCRGGDAEDLVQDVLERALRGFDPAQPPTHPRAWLMTILHNLFVDRCRAAHRQPTEDGAPGRVERLPVPEPEPVPNWATLGLDEVREALNELDEGFRRTYELHDIQGLSYDEIARELQIAKATVGTRLLRARRRLKELLHQRLVGAR